MVLVNPNFKTFDEDETTPHISNSGNVIDIG
jgi:hypothetical protein